MINCGDFDSTGFEEKGTCFPRRVKRDCEAPSVSLLYPNTAQQATSDCPPGSGVPSITVTIAAGSYSSSVSQAAADALALAAAQAEVLAQRAENPCPFESTEQSYTDTCPDGFTGDPITVVIAAGAFTSVVSQADANAQALAAAQAQAEAQRAETPCVEDEVWNTCLTSEEEQPTTILDVDLMSEVEIGGGLNYNSLIKLSQDGKYALFPQVCFDNGTFSPGYEDAPAVWTRSGSSFAKTSLSLGSGAYSITTTLDQNGGPPWHAGNNGLICGTMVSTALGFAIGVYWPTPDAEPVGVDTTGGAFKHFFTCNAAGTVMAGINERDGEIDVIVRRGTSDEIVATFSLDDVSYVTPIHLSNVAGEEKALIRIDVSPSVYRYVVYVRSAGVWSFFTELLVTSPDVFEGTIRDMSSDGSMAVGAYFSDANFRYEACYWDLTTPTTTLYVPLNHSIENDSGNWAHCVTCDASVIFGSQASPNFDPETIDELCYWLACENYLVAHSVAGLFTSNGILDPLGAPYGVPATVNDADWGFVSTAGGLAVSGSGHHIAIPCVRHSSISGDAELTMYFAFPDSPICLGAPYMFSSGYGGLGQLGQGSGTTIAFEYGQIGSELDWVNIAGGPAANALIAVKGDRTVWTWGKNTSSGNLGVGDKVNRFDPTMITIDETWSKSDGFASVGFRHTLLIRDLLGNGSGYLYAAGQNTLYELGLNDTTERLNFTKVGTAANWRYTGAGDQISCALKSDGTLWSWGKNNFGQLGQGDTTTRQVPTKVGLATNWVSCHASSNAIFAINSSGELWGVGYNGGGILGQGNTTNTNVLVQVQGTWASISAGDDHILAIATDGTLWSWGLNNFDQLGNGATGATSVPAQIDAGTTWVKVVAGDSISFAIKSDGTLWAWGDNGEGQLGAGELVATQPIPAQFDTATTFLKVAATAETSVTIKGVVV